MSEDLNQAREIALGLLARREHSALELCRKLQQRGANPELIPSLIEQLQANGLQSDQRFAESFARYRAAKGLGPLRLANELREKGVDSAIIREAIDSLEQDWDQAAVKVREKRFGSKLPDSVKDKQKQMRFLQYRGFAQQQIQHAMQQCEPV